LLQLEIEEESELARELFPGDETPILAREILDYHQLMTPAKSAHYVFDNRFA
jgi:hypothetical protein